VSIASPGREMEAAKKSQEIAIRRCDSLEEFEACVQLQREVWNFSDIDLVPARLFVVANGIGGQVIGAFDGNQMVGFAMAIPGSRKGHSYLHSHMLAVKESYRNLGLGRRLKLFQREDALFQGFELIEWTFDPLEIKNSFLNLEKLGAIARRYYVNHYGITSSALQGGMPTDRLIAEWWLKSKRVLNLLDGGARPAFTVEARIDVPAEIYRWRVSEQDRVKAVEIQRRNRDCFLKAFAAGQAALGYERDAKGNGTFLVGKWDEEWSYGEF